MSWLATMNTVSGSACAASATAGCRAPNAPTAIAPMPEITIQPMPMRRARGTAVADSMAMKRTKTCGCPK